MIRLTYFNQEVGHPMFFYDNAKMMEGEIVILEYDIPLINDILMDGRIIILEYK